MTAEEAQARWAAHYYGEHLPALAQAKVDIYLWQIPANWVLLVMTVILVLSGAVLAALQLYWSYRLGSFGNSSELSVDNKALKVASPFVGLLILIVSFGFFYLFVHEVYRVRDGIETAPPPAISAPASTTSGRLPGVPAFPTR
jgi:hypothetical protein